MALSNNSVFQNQQEMLNETSSSLDAISQKIDALTTSVEQLSTTVTAINAAVGALNTLLTGTVIVQLTDAINQLEAIKTDIQTSGKGKILIR